MKRFNKAISVVIITFIILTLKFIVNINTYAFQRLSSGNRDIVNVAVIFFRMDDPYTMRVVGSLENIEKEKQDEIKFNFFDTQNNIAIQNEVLDTALRENSDLVIMDLLDKNRNIVADVISRVKAKNIPLILMNIPPEVKSQVSTIYNKVAFIAPNSKQAGISQGKLIVDLWNDNKMSLDRNGDDILQYVMLQGPANDSQAIDRTKYAISTINDSGIKTQEIAFINANWVKELAATAIDNLFLKYNGQIEAIISNNDAMAMGALEALQKYGYNTGDMSKNVAIVGIDGLPEAKELIDKGFMTGTVIQDPNVEAEFLYTIGMNLIKNLNPIENTDYKIIDGDIIIPYPYDIYSGRGKNQ